MSDDTAQNRKNLPNRRDLLKVIGTVPAAALVGSGAGIAKTGNATDPQASPPQQPTKAYQPKILNEHEWKTVRMLSDLVIPADARSGSATQAGVPEFLDDWLDLRHGALLAEIRGGLTWLDIECNRQFNRNFLDCSETQQKQILDRIAYPKKAAPEDTAGVSFFSHFRDLVVSGFFSSKMGVEDLPYLGNKMVADWQGCPQEVFAKLGVK